MAALTIELDPVALREATNQAIMGVLTPEVRNKIIETAIRALLTPSTNSWDRNKTALETAFEQAVAGLARQIAVEEVKADAALVEKLRVLVKQTAEKVLNIDVDKMADLMGSAFVSAIANEGERRAR